jgi:hypothetical protein
MTRSCGQPRADCPVSCLGTNPTKFGPALAYQSPSLSERCTLRTAHEADRRAEGGQNSEVYSRQSFKQARISVSTQDQSVDRKLKFLVYKNSRRLFDLDEGEEEVSSDKYFLRRSASTHSVFVSGKEMRESKRESRQARDGVWEGEGGYPLTVICSFLHRDLLKILPR